MSDILNNMLERPNQEKAGTISYPQFINAIQENILYWSGFVSHEAGGSGAARTFGAGGQHTLRGPMRKLIAI